MAARSPFVCDAFSKGGFSRLSGNSCNWVPYNLNVPRTFKFTLLVFGALPQDPAAFRRAKLLIAIAVSLEDKVFQLLCVMDEGIGAVFFELFFVPEAPGDAGGEEAGVLPGLHINAAVADVQAFGGGDA